jgi:ssDNA-binding replication factor A large subunit
VDEVNLPSEEELIKLIMDKKGLTKAQIDELVKKQIDKMKGLINEETALFIIKKSMGLDGDEHKQQATSEKDTPIKEINENLKNVNALGRITDFMQCREFNRKDGTKSFFSSFWIKDVTGEIKVVLWDDRAKYVEQEAFKINEVVRVLNGQVKKSRDGALEVHIGNKGDVELSPSDADMKLVPKFSQVTSKVKISEISIQTRKISVQGTVIIVENTRNFSKKDNSKSLSLRRITIRDESASIPIVFWNEDIEKSNMVNEGDTILLDNLTAKPQFANPQLVELTVNKTTNIKVIKKAGKADQEALTQAIPIQKALSMPDGITNIQGEIVQIENIKDTKKSKLLSFTLSDDSEAIRVNFWGEDAEKNVDLKIGDKLKLNKIYIKDNTYSGRKEASFRQGSTLDKNIKLTLTKTHELPVQSRQTSQMDGNSSGDSTEGRSSNVGSFSNSNSTFTGKYTKIKDITTDGNYEIKGIISKEINRITIFEACDTCRKKAENCSCPGGPKKTEYRMIINPIIDDSTGIIKASFIGDTAQKLLGMDAVTVKMEIDSDNAANFLKELSSKIIGKEFIIKGRGKFSEFSNAYELTVNNFKPLDPEEEAKKILSGLDEEEID